MSEQSRVAWKHKDTGYESHGSPMSREDAEAWCKFANKMYLRIDHWVETVPITEVREVSDE